MQEGPGHHHVHLAPATRMSRRTIGALAAKLAWGASLAVTAGARLARVAAAEDEEIVLTAAASEVGARPGSAYAQGYAALAAADEDAGAITEAATSAPPDGDTSVDDGEVVPGPHGACPRC
jgi:hypothetical protein